MKRINVFDPFARTVPLAALAAFALVSSITPGPNNIMLAAGGANNGVRATVPHMVGIAGGFAVMILAVGLGLSAPLAAFPGALHWMRWVGVVWIAWIAWQVATSPPPNVARTSSTVAPVLTFSRYSEPGNALPNSTAFCAASGNCESRCA